MIKCPTFSAQSFMILDCHILNIASLSLLSLLSILCIDHDTRHKLQSFYTNKTHFIFNNLRGSWTKVIQMLLQLQCLLPNIINQDSTSSSSSILTLISFLENQQHGPQTNDTKMKLNFLNGDVILDFSKH